MKLIMIIVVLIVLATPLYNPWELIALKDFL